MAFDRINPFFDGNKNPMYVQCARVPPPVIRALLRKKNQILTIKATKQRQEWNNMLVWFYPSQETQVIIEIRR
jgi:hypothetical protein